jgi:flagellar biosynthesis protein FlhF
MKLKTYTATTTAEAMNLVRNDMGEDAAIVSIRRADDGASVDVVATLEGASFFGISHAPIRKPEQAGPARVDIYETVCRALEHHGVPGPVTERLGHGAASSGASNPWAALSAALDTEFAFTPTPSLRDTRPVMLVGPPGAGKTLTTAKLAAKAVMAGQSIGVITTDVKRAGAVDQLRAYTRVLDIDLQVAKTPGQLAQAVARVDGLDVVYIDTAAANPFLDADMAGLSRLISATDIDPVVVLPAGENAMDAADMAKSFADIGAKRMIATRLDVARRLGCLLAAADHSRLAFAGVSITPRVARGLNDITAATLARLIMPQEANKAMDTPEAHTRPANVVDAAPSWARAV